MPCTGALPRSASFLGPEGGAGGPPGRLLTAGKSQPPPASVISCPPWE